MPQYTWICDGCTFHLTKTMSIKKYNPREKVYCSNCGNEHAMYGDGDPPLEDAFDKDEDIGYTGII